MQRELIAARTAGRHRRLPEHERHDRRRRRRRGARAARPAPRGRVREGRHRRRGRRARPPARRRPRRQPRTACTAPSSAPPTPTRRAASASRSRSGPTRSRRASRPASSSASTAPTSRRSSSCAATTAASRPSSARSARPARSPTPSPTRPSSTFEQKIELLEAVDVVERLELALRLQRERLAELQVRRRIRDDVEEGAAKQQREYILRKQMESIRKELGEDDASVAEDYRDEDRRGRACPTPCASRPSARSPGSSGWATRAASRR